MSLEILITNKELCVGCNKCIAKCPVKANVAFLFNGENRVKVDHLKCIHCGACIDICDHHARDFADDTERFFSDLKLGHDITVIAAPSIRFNISEYTRLFGYLKSLHVTRIYDVSLGADITTWAYLKAIEEQKLESIIAQPCPVIVNYIQKYRPELIWNLAPIHSPMMCTAIYLKKYLKNHDRIAFLSPCIGKIDEIKEKNTQGFIEYNVTYKKIESYLRDNQIELFNYPESDYDEVGYGIGLTYSRPGGLSENVELYKPDAWVRQIEGPERVYRYLDEYSLRIAEHKPLPLILDILNCQKGCNGGTATCNKISVDDVDFKMNALKKEKVQSYGPSRQESEILAVYELLYKDFRLEDFARIYEDKSGVLKVHSFSDLEEIFTQLHKTTEASRNVNCFACGFGNCREFANAVLQGTNHISNCIDYNRKELVCEKEHLSQTNRKIKQLHYLATHDFLTDCTPYL